MNSTSNSIQIPKAIHPEVIPWETMETGCTTPNPKDRTMPGSLTPTTPTTPTIDQTMIVKVLTQVNFETSLVYPTQT